MKNIKFRIAIVLLAAATIITGCGINPMIRDYEEDVTYTPAVNPLENHGGKVAVEVDGQISEGYFHSSAIVELTPVLRHNGEETTFETKVLRGEGTEVDGRRITDNGPTNITVTDEADFTKEMLASELYMTARIYLEGDEDDAETLPERKVADGVINTSQRVVKDENIELAPHGYEEEVIVTKSANIYYEYMLHRLDWNYELNQEDEAKERIEKVKNFLEKGWEIKSAKVNAWASPEGEIAFNEELAEDRASTTYDYWKDEINDIVEGIEEEGYEFPEIDVTSKGEDYDGFMKKLDASDLPEKDAIRNVINSELDPIEREERIKDMTVIYEEIEKILKPLRRGEIVVEAYEPKRTDEEIAGLATTNPEELDKDELLYAADVLIDCPETMNEIYSAVKELYPECYKAFNNAAYTYLKVGNAEKAAENLEKANELEPNTGYVLNNLGVVAAWEDDYENAQSYYEAAQADGIDTDYNVGNIMIIIGDYDAALSSYAGHSCTHNVSLAHLMNENEQEAMTNLECADETAAVAYLKAIIGARRDDNTMLYENLRKAIELDPDYKEEAQIDREFIEYFEVGEFQEIVN